MDKIKVSVIVPVYNVEKYLEECVESLIKQTLKEIEILLIDDGSTDSSGKICDRYAQQYKNIRVIHKENGGLGDARNAGFLEAVGKYIYFIDSDDYLDLGALDYLYKEAEKNHLDVLLFSAESFSDEADLQFNIEGYKRTKFLNEVYSGKELFDKLHSVQEYYASIPLRIYNREFYKKGKYWFPDIMHEDEFPAFVSLIEAERAECVEYKFYKRRFRKGSIMTSEKAYKSAMGYIETCKRIKYVSNRYESKTVKLCYMYTQFVLKLVIELYCSSFSNDEKKRFKKARGELKRIVKNDLNEYEKGVRLFLICPLAYEKYRCIKGKV